ncbi:MAG: tetratricopeptide repeat protein [Bacteroidetes bacterium]|jgi:tetratricopeptide (TPR) repeat protein|nr:tetratricopeptide repeat protein [Bacteroidota bacterium]
MKKLILVIAILFTASSQAFSQSEPPYGMSEIQAYSIFYENYRTGNYEMAKQYGTWMLDNKPAEIEGYARFSLPRQFERMITVYTELSKQEQDPSLSAAMLDTAATIYDEAFETFSEDEIDYFEWTLDRGRFYQEYQEQLDDGLAKAYENYRTAYEMDPERFTELADGYFVQVLLSNYASRDMKDEALAMIDTVEQYAGESLQQVIDETRDQLFDDPEERVGFLEGRLEQNPGDTEIMNELIDLYDETGQREDAIEMAENLLEEEQTFENAERLAEFAQADGQNQEAIEYFEQALELTDDPDQQKEVMVEIAEILQNEGNLQRARRYARQAINIDNSWGEPYIRIAQIYASAISQCTQGRQIEREDRTVYWLVLDYLDRARSVDPSSANTVNRLYNTYEPVLPSAEDKFFRGWETGDDFRIGSNIGECYSWIGETTTVR